MNRIVALGLLILLGACSRDESRRASPSDITRQDSYASPELQSQDVGPDGVIHELVGTRWALVRLGGEPVTVREGAREAFIALESGDARAVGHAGCNRIVGGYELSGEQLRFRQMASTRMACPEMAIEDALLEALDTTVRWSIAGDGLDLFDADGTAVASFEARNL